MVTTFLAVGSWIAISIENHADPTRHIERIEANGCKKTLSSQKLSEGL